MRFCPNSGAEKAFSYKAKKSAGTEFHGVPLVDPLACLAIRSCARVKTLREFSIALKPTVAALTGYGCHLLLVTCDSILGDLHAVARGRPDKQDLRAPKFWKNVGGTAQPFNLPI